MSIERKGHQIMTDQAFHVFGANRIGDWVVTCDHASNRVPPEIGGGSLGIAEADMMRHIAYDVGAAGVSRRLGDMLAAPVILSNFSRLVIDPNRGEDDPTLVMKLYDGTIIPENRGVDLIETERRLDAYYRPYHGEVADQISVRRAPILIAIHSFTPQFKGRPARPWHVAILHTKDTRLSDPMLEALRSEGGLTVGQNEPYTGELAGDSVDRHATAKGHPNLLIEIRNDLIETEQQQTDWARRLARCLDVSRAAANL